MKRDLTCDERSFLVKVLSDAVQTGQVDDSQTKTFDGCHQGKAIWDEKRPIRTPAEKQRNMTLGAKAERHNPAAAITEPDDDDVDGDHHDHDHYHYHRVDYNQSLL